jgi:hypothetical protein
MCGSRRVLELIMNTGERFQHYGVGWDLAVTLSALDASFGYLRQDVGIISLLGPPGLTLNVIRVSTTE